jgi:translation initiation factor 2B subunit (eIF-2B alpha/beta/delta family)
MNYYIGTTEKVLESWKDDFLLRQGSRDEIYEGDGSVHVENYYFDLTPASYISGLFLETGISRMF